MPETKKPIHVLHVYWENVEEALTYIQNEFVCEVEAVYFEGVIASILFRCDDFRLSSMHDLEQMFGVFQRSKPEPVTAVDL